MKTNYIKKTPNDFWKKTEVKRQKKDPETDYLRNLTARGGNN